VDLAKLSLDIGTLRATYAQGALQPLELMRELLRRIAAAPERHVWISRPPDSELLAAAATLAERDPADLPLYGIPFAVKDNIDVAGLPTTAACPRFAYTAAAHAPAVERLIAAGALMIGKTNLDQFATGLVGTRSPYGECRNSFDDDYISGGSSSGSAVAVATGLASFTLGTDTAGSGRVPAAFNNLIGYKPTCGLISPRGMVPACRSLDTISVFALCAEDAALAGATAAAFDAQEPYSRHALPLAPQSWQSGAPWRFATPCRAQLRFYGNQEFATLYERALDRLQSLGGTALEFDLEPFLEVAQLLYEGPWIAERLAALTPLIDEHPDALLPITRGIIEGGRGFSAADAFRAQYRLQSLRRQCAAIWREADVLVTPTAGTIHTRADVAAAPLERNSELGYYTNFVNLLDLAAVAVPAGFGANGLPFGISLLAPAWSDADLLALAARAQRALVDTAGATGLPLPSAAVTAAISGSLPASTALGWIDVAVCGAHMEALPLNGQLTGRGARLKARTRSAPHYRFYALPGGPPFRPGMVRVAEGGVAIELEVWSMPAEHFGSFTAGIPAPLGIGKVELEDGSRVSGFLCESYAAAGAQDISALANWRAYLAAAAATPAGGPAAPFPA